MAIISFKTKRLLIKYAGVIAGALYGVLMRIIFNIPGNPTRFNWADLFSLTFVWLVPVVIGIIPMLFASKKQLSSSF